ncbi:hypothetical protein [Saccharopolyspora sp. SCSIO 74807]|uniref:hypothetical protein n=1 Tax=Saccharopolyspora sp. SCSIO 74807 TaxID=3118084 RepID=UPI0030D03C9E
MARPELDKGLLAANRTGEQRNHRRTRGCSGTGHTGEQKPKLEPRQVQLARELYDETDDDGKRRYTVAQIAAGFSVTRPTIYRHLTADCSFANKIITAASKSPLTCAFALGQRASAAVGTAGFEPTTP